MKRILLISPLLRDQYHKVEEGGALSNTDVKKAFMAPIAIATVASLTPPDFDVERACQSTEDQHRRRWDFKVHRSSEEQRRSHDECGPQSDRN